MLKGKVTIRNITSGLSTTYKSGDCWIIKQGSHVTWEVKSEEFVKSFFVASDEDQ